MSPTGRAAGFAVGDRGPVIVYILHRFRALRNDFLGLAAAGRIIGERNPSQTYLKFPIGPLAGAPGASVLPPLSGRLNDLAPRPEGNETTVSFPSTLCSVPTPAPTNAPTAGTAPPLVIRSNA